MPTQMDIKASKNRPQTLSTGQSVLMLVMSAAPSVRIFAKVGQIKSLALFV